MQAKSPRALESFARSRFSSRPFDSARCHIEPLRCGGALVGDAAAGRHRRPIRAVEGLQGRHAVRRRRRRAKRASPDRVALLQPLDCTRHGSGATAPAPWRGPDERAWATRAAAEKKNEEEEEED